MNLHDEPGLFDARRTAAFLGIKVSTVYAWCARGRLPFVRLGRALRFDQKSLSRWIDEQRVDRAVDR
jgi:excisionase family DNA binding protein